MLMNLLFSFYYLFFFFFKHPYFLQSCPPFHLGTKKVTFGFTDLSFIFSNLSLFLLSLFFV